MPIQCRMIDPEKVPREERKPGDMWYAEHLVDRDIGRVHMVSRQYNEQWLGKRAPIAVILPNGESFIVDMYYTIGDNPNLDGWTVTGEAPNITVSPSINLVLIENGYHGWLQNGILSDDLEGRTYNNEHCSYSR